MCSPTDSGIMNTLVQSTPRPRNRSFPWCHLFPFFCGAFFWVGVLVAETLPQTGIDNNGVECFAGQRWASAGLGNSESSSVSQNQGPALTQGSGEASVLVLAWARCLELQASCPGRTGSGEGQGISSCSACKNQELVLES